jgi:hypothetical protein
MVTYKEVHAFEAVSSSVRVEQNDPTVGGVNFRLSTGDHIDLQMTRARLQTLQHQIAGALKSTPLPAAKL